jgi:hypothetical protein
VEDFKYLGTTSRNVNYINEVIIKEDYMSRMIARIQFRIFCLPASYAKIEVFKIIKCPVSFLWAQHLIAQHKGRA